MPLENIRMILVVVPTMENAYHNLKHFVSVSPPIGLTSIAATALRAGCDVSIIDGDAENLTMEQLVTRVVDKNPLFVGATIMTATMDITRDFFTLLKKKIPETVMIAGGPHVSALPEQTMEDIPALDIGVIGEGDLTIVDIVNAYKNQLPLRDVDGIVYKKNDKIIITRSRPPIANLGCLPVPANHLLKKHLYRSYLWSRWVSGRNGPIGVIFTARGCIGRCNFCASHTVFGPKVRYFDMQQVYDQLEFFINEWNVRILYLQDDTFNLNRKRVNELCYYIIEKGYNQRLEIQISSRANTAHLPTLKKMRTAGVRWVFFGIESGNQQILDQMDKNIHLDQIRSAVANARKAGMFVGGNYIIGCLGETRETAKDTIKLACELEQDYASFATAIPLPGTGLYQYCLEKNIALPAWNDFGSVNTPPIALNSTLTAEELCQLRDMAVNRFFIRPGYLIKILIRLKTFIVLKDFVTMFFALRKEKKEKRL